MKVKICPSCYSVTSSHSDDRHCRNIMCSPVELYECSADAIQLVLPLMKLGFQVVRANMGSLFRPDQMSAWQPQLSFHSASDNHFSDQQRKMIAKAADQTNEMLVRSCGRNPCETAFTNRNNETFSLFASKKSVDQARQEYIDGNTGSTLPCVPLTQHLHFACWGMTLFVHNLRNLLSDD